MQYAIDFSPHFFKMRKMSLRIPTRPPAFDIVLKKLASDRKWRDLFVKIPVPPGAYYSYDDIKYRPLPDVLRGVENAREIWWARILMGREARFQDLPLCDLAGNPFRFFVDDADARLLHHLDLDGGGSLGVDGALLPSGAERKRYFIHSLMEESIASSVLEGAVTTREVARKMLAEQRPPRNKSERMILNNYATMQALEGLCEMPLSVEMIDEIHSLISRDTMPAEQCGRFRLAAERVCLSDEEGNEYYTPPPAEALPARMEALCRFANEEGTRFIHPVIKAVILHFWLAYEHPYVDGNGRTARALFYWYLLKHRYWIFKYISISNAILASGKRYYTAFLDSENEGNDLNYFIKFQLEVTERALNDFHAYIERKCAERASLESGSPVVGELNERQKALLSRLLRKRHEYAQTTVVSHANLNEVSLETARRDLDELVELRLLLRRRSGKKHVYLPAEDLEKRIGL